MTWPSRSHGCITQVRTSMTTDRRKKKRIVRYSGGYVTPYIPYVMSPDQFPGNGDVTSGGGEVSGGGDGGGGAGGAA